MVYDCQPNIYCDGEWHCPFSRRWVEKMKSVVKMCEKGRIVRKYPRGFHLDCLSEPQDSRGLPLSFCMEEEKRYEKHPKSCTATYDYDSIPDVVVTNGLDDWPLTLRTKKIQL